jgi:L-fuconate dehydratase
MPHSVIESIATRDARFALPPEAGTDAVHTDSEYRLAVTLLKSSGGLCGTGIALTLGEGNRLVCETNELLARPLAGMEIEDLLADFGTMSRRLADDPSFPWLGPHKGVVHLALASVTNACFDLWAKSRGVPLRKTATRPDPGAGCRSSRPKLRGGRSQYSRPNRSSAWQSWHRTAREPILPSGYPGYDTSVGWMAYDDDKVRGLIGRAISQGFRAFKLKVGSADEKRDLRRTAMLRECV